MFHANLDFFSETDKGVYLKKNMVSVAFHPSKRDHTK